MWIQGLRVPFDPLSDRANNSTQDLKGWLNAIVLSLHGINLYHVLNSKYYLFFVVQIIAAPRMETSEAREQRKGEIVQ